jgi:regulator of sirC expression with transglutaminase-like and TPR domain
MSFSDKASERLVSLLKLLDDDTPAVRIAVREALRDYEGDVSEELASLNVQLSEADQALLSSLLMTDRRERLRREWVVPEAGADAVADDWEHFEALLRQLSDYLHDGVTLRQPLGDALDLLAEEVEPELGMSGEAMLNQLLFSAKKLRPNFIEEDAPENYDLAAALAGRPTNSLGMGLIFLLMANRLQLQVEGLSLPGAFLCRYEDDGQVVITDPLLGGREILAEDLEHRVRKYPRDVRERASRAATPGELLIRVIEELATSWAARGELEDAELMETLLNSLIKTPF